MTLTHKITIPGKLMLVGEYAVLFGGTALASSITREMRMYAELSNDKNFHIQTPIWNKPFIGDLETIPHDLERSPLVRALKKGQEHFQNAPLHIRIESQLDLKGGMGSSSAVILGALAACAHFAKNSNDASPLTLAKLAYTVQRDLQGQASGYDVLTQCLGGLVSLQNSDPSWPGHWQRQTRLEKHFARCIHFFVGGRGAPTIPVMTDTLNWLKNHDQIENMMSCSEKLYDGFQKFFADTLMQTHDLIPLIVKHRKIFAESPHFPKDLAQILRQVPGCDERWTFKTTGSGGEDALLLVGNLDCIGEATQVLAKAGWSVLDSVWTDKGLCVEEIHSP